VTVGAWAAARVLGVALLALALPGAVLFGGGTLLVARTSGPFRPPGVTPLAQRWRGYTEQDAASYWRGFEPDGALEAEQRFLEADLVFPFFYGAALLASLLRLRAATGGPLSPVLFVGLVGATVLADWTENLVQLREIAPFLTSPSAEANAHWIAVSSAATRVKLAGCAVSFFVVAGMAAAWAGRRVR
jgi:hypothetical protein